MGIKRMNDIFKDRQLHGAMNQLRGRSQINNSDEDRVKGWLTSSLRGMRKKNDELQGDQLAWNQGACQLLQELIDTFDVSWKPIV